MNQESISNVLDEMAPAVKLLQINLREDAFMEVAEPEDYLLRLVLIEQFELVA